MRRRVREFFSRVVAELEIYSSQGRIGAPVNLFFYSIGGRKPAVLSRFERIVVTILGDYCPSFIEPFTAQYVRADPPWSAYVRLRSGWEGYVRVVPAHNSINSVLKKEIVRKYTQTKRPARVYTIQGEDFDAREIASGLAWFGPTDTWRHVTGDPAGYSKFKDIVFEVGRDYRDRFWRAVDRMVGNRGSVGKA
ncbi:MAG: hypothetical protein QXV75_07835 [Candidatus Bathyarchaeia archaeon]